jgi:hypothetical protein
MPNVMNVEMPETPLDSIQQKTCIIKILSNKKILYEYQN